jgi:hypothetical protein
MNTNVAVTIDTTNVDVSVSTGTYEVTAIGVTGLKGDTGDTGPANSLAIGTVSTVAAGGSATATITGTAPSQTLNLGIPTGATGAANSLAIGTVSTVSAGGSATATITGTAPSQTLNLRLPTGATGAANSLTIGTVSTVAAGGSATATITGTAPNQTLNLGIPTGAAGAQGSWSAAQPNRAWSSSTTLVSGDAGYLILVDSATAISVTSSLGLSVGQRIDFLVTNATVPTISAGSGVTLNGTPTTTIRARYSAATLICTASNIYVLVGDLAAA